MPSPGFENDAPLRGPDHVGGPPLLEGPLAALTFALCVAISIAHLYFNLFNPVSVQAQNIFHFAGFALLCALTVPAAQKAWALTTWARVLDVVIGLLVAGAAIYLIFAQDAIFARGVRLSTADWIASAIVVLGAIELTRRTTGWIIPALIMLSLSYIVWWGAHINGIFHFPGLSLETVMFRSVYGDDALFGNIARISATYVFLFILFGAFLLKSGAGDFLIDLSSALAGRFRGGPGFVSVIASGLTGTISGSAVANTASTGVITIPMMKRAGFPGPFAGGVEAAASTGGQLMPPVMGAGAFVMAASTQIPYTTIIAAALLPALLYFLTVAYFVRIAALRVEPSTGARPEAPPLPIVLRRSGPVFIIPIGALVAMLIAGFTPTYAACIGILACIAGSWFTTTPMGLREILDALALGARNMTTTAVLLCSVGLIVNVIATVGVGTTFSLMISEWAGGNLFIAVILVAVASLVLGMGLPVTASYIVLGALSAPALHQLILHSQLVDLIAAGALPEGARAIFALADPSLAAKLSSPLPLAEARSLAADLPLEARSMLYEQSFTATASAAALLSAHMIVFWLSQDSNVTPPVCLAAFTAAAIAKAPPMRTGLAAWRTAKGIYIIPLLFAYTPLLSASWLDALTIFAFAALGLWALSAVLEGHWEAPLPMWMRSALAVLGVILLSPLGLIAHAGAAALMALLFFLHRRSPQGTGRAMP